MLLSLSTTYKPATDLGFLLHKHPDKLQSVDLSIGKCHIFYPESGEEKCTINLVLDIDPIDLVRASRKSQVKGFTLGQYVNDRPYVASSFMSVAISKAFSSAMNGNCKDRPELVDTIIPLEVKVAVLPAPKGGEQLIRKLFEPLGYTVDIERHSLDKKFPNWGDSKYYTLKLSHNTTVKDLLSHLYVLIPALDNDKHYYVSQNEIDKLLTKGKGWLEDHPEREQIIRRYLINLGSLTRQAYERLNEEDEVVYSPEAEGNKKDQKQKESLHQQRLSVVLEELKKSEAKTVIDLGCGEGKLLRSLIKESQFLKITGMDVSYEELTKAKDRLYWDDLPPMQRERLNLFQGALTYKDKRLEGYDAATLVEVIEHLDENRLQSLERVVFEFARPKMVILTTPNAEYNSVFETMEAGAMRHTDHRFEWTRNEFEEWAKNVALNNNYKVEFRALGPEQEKFGAPSQMGIFTYGD